MRKLSEIKNDDALDLIATTIDPISRIFSDAKIGELRKKKASKIDIVKWAITDHRHDVLEILAALDGTPIDKFEISAIEIPMRILEVLNDKELISLFTSQGQTAKASSGSAMENTEAKGQ